jgi:ParB-like chromosome segregation protein Spo0J
VLKLDLEQIRANAWNCNFLGTQERHNLKQRMSEDGPEKTLPVVVRKVLDTYELVDGEHRWAIARELGWKTINALEREADDLQSRALCISYNRWRGRLNWFKLCDIVKKDQDKGIDIEKAYQEALSSKELEELLTLNSLIPEAKIVLEDALKKHPEITLEHLYLLSQFPATQQERLVEKFKTPVVAHALMQALTPFIQRNQPQPYAKETNPQPTLQETKNQTTYTIPQRAPQPIYPKEAIDKTETPIEKETNTQPTPTMTKPAPLSSLSPESLMRQDDPKPNTPAISQLKNSDMEQAADRQEFQQAILLAVSYDCACGRHYNINFKNRAVLVQKQNLLFEHVDIKPRTFQVHCNKCNSNHEFTVEGIENQTLQIFCRRCKPLPREGRLDSNTGEAAWLDD